jgi:hypothetical protein
MPSWTHVIRADVARGIEEYDRFGQEGVLRRTGLDNA